MGKPQLPPQGWLDSIRAWYADASHHMSNGEHDTVHALLAEIEALRARAETAERERDGARAALADIAVKAHAVCLDQPAGHARDQGEADRWGALYEAVRGAMVPRPPKETP